MTQPLLIRRFTPVQRMFHFVLVLDFMLMSVTGLALMFTGTAWGDLLNALFGGYQGAIDLHRISGVVMLVGFVVYMIYLIAIIDWHKLKATLTSPDSLLPLWRDAREFAVHLGWIIGLKKAPRFERWTWWEKFDLIAVFWGIFLLGITGLMMYDPVLTSDYLPGWFFNVTLWIHRIEAVLAMVHLFTVHFFVENWRPSNFPYNSSMFDGHVREDKLRHHHSAWVDRLEKQGDLYRHTLDNIPVPLRITYFGFGYLTIALGIYLLIFGIVNISLLAFFGL